MAHTLDQTQFEKLKLAAIAAQANSYSPYSNYAVGAAILTDDGDIFSGTNVENAAYPLGTCAEAGAIAAMVLAGQRKIAAVMIVSPDEEKCTPCGGCRQKLAEFAQSSIMVYGTNSLGALVYEKSMGDLLPDTFRLALD